MAKPTLIRIPTDERLRSLLVQLQKNDELFGKTSESSLDILFSLEAYYEEIGSETEVLKTCRKILTRNEARPVPDDAVSCEFLVRESYALMALEQYGEAEKSARKALPLTRMIAGPDSYPYYLNNRILVDAMERNGKQLTVTMLSGQKLYPEILAADMVVFASPIYYFTLSAQLQAVIQRTYAINIPKHVKKVALIMSSGSKFVYGAAITEYFQSIVEYWGVENAGIFTANGRQNKSKMKRQELYRFGKSL